MEKRNRADGRINSPFRHMVEMENTSFNYDDHIANYLEREDKRGNSKQAREKVMSSYSDMIHGKAYGKHNPEYLDELGYNQHYDNPIERQYQINKRKSERVSVITKKPDKFQANLDANKTSSHFNETNGWQKAQGWTDELKKNWNKGDKVRSGLVSAGGLLTSKLANWNWKHMVGISLGAGALSIGLYSSRKAEEDATRINR
jgi:hypothetical protein